MLQKTVMHLENFPLCDDAMSGRTLSEYQSSLTDARITVVVLAGSRPGRDPLANAAGVATKALVPVAGSAMIDHIVRTLTDHHRIGQVIILSQQGAEILARDTGTQWLAQHDKIRFAPSGAGISQSILDLMQAGTLAPPFLLTTVDNILLDHDCIEAFLADVGDADVAVAMVERATLMQAYPQSRRTWLKFRNGWWSGANLFWLGSAKARSGLELWRSIEQDRKKGWRIVSAFGPLLLAGAALRVMTIHQAVARAGKRLGLRARIVDLPIPEACIDADKPEDITLIEEILARRKNAAVSPTGPL